MRRRMVTLAVLAAVLATTLFGIPLALVLATYYHNDEIAELERLADRAAIQIAADQVAGRPVDELPGTELGTTLALYGAGGTLLLGDGPAQADPVVRAALAGELSITETGGRMAVAVPLTDDETVTGVVRASSANSEVLARIGRTLLLMLGFAVLAVTVAWLLARWQAGRLVAPLLAMSNTAEELGGGDFTVRAKRSGIPEIDSLAKSLDSTAQRLGTLVSRERSFSADASHQLRTPLTGLRLGLETAAEAADPSTRAAMLEAIKSADRLERTIDDLLALARDPAARSEPLALAELLAEIRTRWHATLAAQGRPLRITVTPDLPNANASTAAARQVLAVLLENAEVHGAGAVTVNVRDVGGVLGIDVSDEGPGIDLPHDQLFQRGATTADRNGIGLALARSLAEGEGGRLILGKPAPPTFTLLLPVADRGSVGGG